jgi:hypothetical protein
MPRLFFENVTRRVQLGGTVTGTLVVEGSHPIDPSAVRVDFTAAEQAFVIEHDAKRRRHGEPMTTPHPSSGVHLGPAAGPGGRPSELVEETRPFIEMSVQGEGLGDAGSMVYRLPFSFEIPRESLPSLRTGVLRESGHAVYRPPPFGMFVEYLLEGRVHHPMWVDHVDVQPIDVRPPSTHLGYLTNLRLDDPARSLTLMVNPGTPAITPGTPLTGFFQVLNPQRVKLETLTISLVRRVRYAARGIAHLLEVPRYEQAVEVPHHEEKFAGQFSVPIPDDVDTLPAMRGTPFETEWVFQAHLKGGILSEPITVEEPVAPPPSTAPPPSG